MIFGMPTFTFVHVVLSLVGIFSGFVVIYGMLTSQRLKGWTAFFLTTTVLTSVTGFMFPFHKFLPSHGLGILSLIALAIALVALYVRHLEGGWRRTYVITAIIAQYFNVFVLIAQLFMKVPALNALAPKGSEPPFLIAQVTCMIIFIILGVMAAKRFHPSPLG